MRSARLKTIPARRGDLVEKADQDELEDLEEERPLTRGDCATAPRPCPFVGCKHNLYLEVNQHTGSIQFNFPELELEELEETCALDVADRDGSTLERVGHVLNLTRERIRQIEVRGLVKLKGHPDVDGNYVNEFGGPDRKD